MGRAMVGAAWFNILNPDPVERQAAKDERTVEKAKREQLKEYYRSAAGMARQKVVQENAGKMQVKVADDKAQELQDQTRANKRARATIRTGLDNVREDLDQAKRDLNNSFANLAPDEAETEEDRDKRRTEHRAWREELAKKVSVAYANVLAQEKQLVEASARLSSRRSAVATAVL